MRETDLEDCGSEAANFGHHSEFRDLQIGYKEGIVRVICPLLQLHPLRVVTTGLHFCGYILKVQSVPYNDTRFSVPST